MKLVIDYHLKIMKKFIKPSKPNDEYFTAKHRIEFNNYVFNLISSVHKLHNRTIISKMNWS